ncbi:BamA/TamA family outer membrane protein [candidate division WOR-3 bacterium]|uniref:BamA/TamA family outer membrane protein n=1 Tax=candidate division WOR-3 bacterium TaxID=2052148 RepID=A0A9D5QC54_UNCW3|nr:BamA/TamA family outer membrane protein [candidate division WOR-3 bacterium]MBD3364169.1 BamA/TamA family outer membrane protein [candidate division WOR-3 bacterium]
MNILYLSLILLAQTPEAEQIPAPGTEVVFPPGSDPSEIAEGPIIFASPKVNKIEIRGNKNTRENVIRRELTFVPGDYLTPEVIAGSEKALMSTGIFARVRIEAAEPEVSESEVIVEVTEFTFPLPYPTIGIDASSGWYIGGGVLYPNLLGQGLHIDAGGDIGFKVKTTPRYTWYTNLEFPVTYNRRHGEKLGYRYFEVWRKDAEITRRENRLFYKQSVRPWRPLTFFLEGGWLRIKSFAPDSVCTPTFCPDSVDASLYLQPGFILDFRDDVLFPTKGALVVGAFTYNPGLKEAYQTQRACSLSVAGYYPLGKTVIAGNIWTYQQLDSIPVYNTLYLGNARIVRGWADTSQVDQCLTVASVELRRYFWSTELPAIGEFKVGGNLFFDIGAAHEPGLPPLYLANTEEDTHDGLLTGTGFGLTLEAIGFVVKGEIAWGIGAEEGALSFIPLPIRYPVYFGWRF